MRLFSNFMLLSQTRQPGFSGLGSLRLSDIIALYEVERWGPEADMDAKEFIDTMIYLDGAMHEFYAERKPRK